MGCYDKVYSTGKKDSKTAIVAIYDIYGYYPQTLQGADLLADSIGARLVMPDLFFGEPYILDGENKMTIQQFFQTKANIEKALTGLVEVSKILREEGATKVYAYGLCWGGKVATVGGSKTLEVDGKTIPAFDGVAAIHPAMLSAKDSEGLLVPLGLYPSKDEPLEEYKKLVEGISTKPFAEKNSYRLYATMHHGWCGARAKLDDEDNKKEFQDLYGRLGTFYTNIGLD